MTQIDSLIRIRRGTDSERQTTLLSAGEAAYTTDTKRFYIGDGTTVGGVNTSSKVFFGTSPTISAVIGDLFYKTNTSVFYLLTSTAGGDNLGNYARLTPNASSGLSYTGGTFTLDTSFFNTASSGYVRLSGDTMSGKLTINSTLSVSQSASFAGQVDLNSNKIINVANPVLSSDVVNLLTLTNQITGLSANLMNIVNSLIVGLSGNYVRKTGDSITGAVTIHSTLSVVGNITTNSDVIAFA